MDLVFCGVNPGLYTAWAGHHFARPGNRFWKVIHLAGFTGRQLRPSDQRQLLGCRIGITNLVARATARADELSTAELREGALVLAEKMCAFAPHWLAVLGVTAYRIAFDQPAAVVGPQAARIAATRVWLLPNPSGLNAHHQLPELVEQFGRLREAIRAAA